MILICTHTHEHTHTHTRSGPHFLIASYLIVLLIRLQSSAYGWREHVYVQYSTVRECVCVCLCVCVCPCMDTSMWVCVCVGLYTCISITSVYCMVRLEEVELWCVSTSSSTESDACQNPNSPVHSDTHHLPPSWTSSSLDIIRLCCLSLKLQNLEMSLSTRHP